MPDIRARFKRLRHLKGREELLNLLRPSDTQGREAVLLRHITLADARRQKHARTGARGELPLLLGDVGGYRVLCGAVDIDGKLCPEMLGYAAPYAAGRPYPDDWIGAWAATKPGGAPLKPGDWFLYHPRRLVQREDGSYELYRPPRRPDPYGWRTDSFGNPKGRRPRPERELPHPVIPPPQANGVSWVEPNNPAGDARMMIGEAPLLPAVVVCAQCRRRNYVEAPPQLPGALDHGSYGWRKYNDTD